MENASSFQAHFHRLCARVCEDDARGTGSVLDLEPSLVEIVELCRVNLREHRSDIVDAFAAAFRTNDSLPLELFEYCMHRLRLLELLPEARRWRDEAAPGSRAEADRQAFVSDLEAASRDDWEDAEMWPSLHCDID